MPLHPDVLKRTDIPPAAKVVLAVMDQNQESGICSMTLDEISHAAGIARSTTDQSLQLLCAEGCLRIRQGGAGSRGSDYEVMPDAPFELTADSQRRKAWVDADLVRIYKAYPRAVGRAVALAKIKAALARLSLKHEDPAGVLYRRVCDYAKSCEGKDKKFVPHCATWMHQGRYLDDNEEWFVDKPETPDQLLEGMIQTKAPDEDEVARELKELRAKQG